MDLVFLQPGTVIANFKLKEGLLQRFPNTHGYHVSLFAGWSPLKASTGEPLGIIVVDQWHNRRVGPRTIKVYSEAEAKSRRILPCDNANEFYVVMT